MPLPQPQALSIQLSRMDQKSPLSAGPLGRILALINGRAVKYSLAQGDYLKVGKRNGYQPLSRTVFNVANTTPMPDGIASPTVLTSLGDQLVAIGANTPNVYSKAGASWQRHPQPILTNTLTQTPIVGSSQQISLPDFANVGDSFCYMYKQAAQMWATFQDSDGTATQLPFINGAGIGKIVSDGTLIWVFHDNATTTVTAFVYSKTGTFIGSGTADTLEQAGDVWDVVYDGAAGGVFMARPLVTTGARLTQLTVSGSTVTATPNDNTSIPTNHFTTNAPGLGFLTSDLGNGLVYLGCIASDSGTGGYSVSVVSLDAAANINHTYTAFSTGSGNCTGIANITGFTVAGATPDVYVSWTQFPTTIASEADGFSYIRSQIITYKVEGGGSVTGPSILRSASLGSRATKVGGQYVFTAYYASVITEVNSFGASSSGQPTLFLVTADTQKLVGRMLHGKAAMDWTHQGWVTANGGTSVGIQPGPNFFCLPSAGVDADGDVHIPCGYSYSPTAQVIQGEFLQTTRFVFSVGLMDLSFGKPGQALAYNSETLIPGPMSWRFNGSVFTSCNVELVPESPAPGSSHTGTGPFASGQTYSYIIVWEEIDARGKRIQSGPSFAVTAGVTPGNDTISLTIPTLRLTTHTTLSAGVYRTIWANGIEGTVYQKVSQDIDPVLNDPFSDTITFVDTVTNDQAAQGQPLYSDGSATAPLVYHPAPPFRQGTVFLDRAIVVGPDNKLYYSFSANSGQALAFNEDTYQISLPSNAQITAVQYFGSRLVILCSDAFWQLPGASLLDGNGNGDIETPQQIPVAGGCPSGISVVTQSGLIYAGADGNAWQLDGGLNQTFIGSHVEDETKASPIISMTVDDSDVVHVGLANGRVLVYDAVSAVWSVDVPPSTAVVAAEYRGQVTYADGTDVYRLTPGAYADGAAAIITSVKIAPMSFAGVAGFVCLWALLFLGENLGDHVLTITLTYDYGTDAEFTETLTFAPSDLDLPAGAAYRWEIQPANLESSAVSIEITDSFPNSPSQGFTLENIGAEVGIDGKLARLAISQRVGSQS